MFFMCKAFIPAMVEAGKGNVINIASTAGLRGGRNRPIYAASKGAVVLFTRSIAIDFGPKGVRANCVAPGLIDTPMASWISDDKEALAKWEKTIPGQRIGTSDDIGKAVSYLASDNASWVLGETLVVDGGGMA
jgi:3-oxoacyl-[acyl-carrier protein] reductase